MTARQEAIGSIAKCKAAGLALLKDAYPPRSPRLQHQPLTSPVAHKADDDVVLLLQQDNLPPAVKGSHQRLLAVMHDSLQEVRVAHLSGLDQSTFMPIYSDLVPPTRAAVASDSGYCLPQSSLMLACDQCPVCVCVYIVRTVAGNNNSKLQHQAS